MDLETIEVRTRENICFVRFISDSQKNCISDSMIAELGVILDEYEESCNVIVLEGNESYFCFGADFDAIGKRVLDGVKTKENPASLFDLWNRMVNSPSIILSHVQGSVNAGGMGFVSASDIVIASNQATFSLSELLFGLMPAMVLPFLIRRVGYSKANYLAMTTKGISSETAYEWGLADVCSNHSTVLLRQTIARLAKIPKDGIRRYKRYCNSLNPITEEQRKRAIEANLEVFSDPVNIRRIANFSERGIYPWEEQNA